MSRFGDLIRGKTAEAPAPAPAPAPVPEPVVEPAPEPVVELEPPTPLKGSKRSLRRSK
jgi:hypothetical protein